MGKIMNNIFLIKGLSTLVLSLSLITTYSIAQISDDNQLQALDGRSIALKVDAVDTSLDTQQEATMLIKRGSQQLVRKLDIFTKKFENNERSLMRFNTPADIRDTQYLSWSYKDIEKNDDLWVFFPSENLIRRISGGGKKGAFMRSDFANEDIEQRAVDDDIHTLLEEAELYNTPVYVIESKPIASKAKDSNYSKRKLWIDKEKWLTLQVEYFDRRGKFLKRLSQGGIENIQGIWTATKLIMETPKKKSRTLLQYNNIRYNTQLDDKVFDQRVLKR